MRKVELRLTEDEFQGLRHLANDIHKVNIAIYLKDVVLQQVKLVSSEEMSNGKNNSYKD